MNVIYNSANEHLGWLESSLIYNLGDKNACAYIKNGNIFSSTSRNYLGLYCNFMIYDKKGLVVGILFLSTTPPNTTDPITIHPITIPPIPPIDKDQPLPPLTPLNPYPTTLPTLPPLQVGSHVRVHWSNLSWSDFLNQ